MALAPDDPAREKILALREANATPEQIMAAMETYQVNASYLVKALSAGHAKILAGDVLQHIIDLHVQEGSFAISGLGVIPEPISWLTGPLTSGTDD